jgi:hypothetical protein
MATKLFTHPSGGYLLETTGQNYRFSDIGAVRTEETGSGMAEAYSDIVVQGVIDNCLTNSNEALVSGEIEVLSSFIQHLIETAE